MEIRLLGPVEVVAGPRRVPAGRRQLRVMLAVLAAAAPRPVPVPVLIDRVWGEHPPAGVRQAVWTRVAGIRKVLAEGAGEPVPVVSWQPGGYVLRVDPDRVDLHRFRRLTAAARRPGCPDPERVTLLAAALDLWRGTPLAGLGGEWVARQRDSWQLERLDAAVAWARAAVRVGRHAAVAPVARDLLEDHPHSEPLATALVRALAADHRTGEALAECRAACERVRRDLGVPPGRELLSLRQALLGGEPLPVPPAAAGPVVVPAQLPADVAGFAGRRPELARLDALLDGAAGVIAVSGTAGVGKTALTAHWAHRVRGRFPDGQLYLNLRGFDPGGPSMEPAEASGLVLDGLGVPAGRIPAGPDARAALYRSLLAGRRVLVVLDNARDAAQVRPLLPGAPGSLVLVSSRTTLTGLVAANGAHLLALDPLPPAEARQLLAARLGRTRVAAEPAAVTGIVTACAGLPLALVIAAARALTRPRLRLDVLAGELLDARSRLAVLSGDDPGTDLGTVLSWSYAALSPPARRLFRLLGPVPGPDLTPAAAASLAGTPVHRIEPLLTELTRANVFAEPVPGRYRCHELLRSYAVAVGSGAPDPTARA
ncbi:BTAD domain-containing putative transcriptional regulator [Amycolatopsis sp. lyj-346]|uniref:AfsR/SARP family transcriptional regulator n=1 Tax=Amycolatopsis sp. lyj-346 TaxID=2789289 RepID=UPI00397E5973